MGTVFSVSMEIFIGVVGCGIQCSNILHNNINNCLNDGVPGSPHVLRIINQYNSLFFLLGK